MKVTISRTNPKDKSVEVSYGLITKTCWFTGECFTLIQNKKNDKIIAAAKATEATKPVEPGMVLFVVCPQRVSLGPISVLYPLHTVWSDFCLLGIPLPFWFGCKEIS
jgi:hypothetical protein